METILKAAVYGAHYRLYINQRYRDTEVVQINRTRARLEYYLPHTGLTGTWVRLNSVEGEPHLVLERRHGHLRPRSL